MLNRKNELIHILTDLSPLSCEPINSLIDTSNLDAEIFFKWRRDIIEKANEAGLIYGMQYHCLKGKEKEEALAKIIEFVNKEVNKDGIKGLLFFFIPIAIIVAVVIWLFL